MDKIDKIITESINDFINEDMGMHREPLVEMSRINTNESNIFPYNKFEVKIWSNDHEPPHFHVICDGWNLSFGIEDGELMKVDQEGVNQGIYKHIVKNAKKWLQSKCAILPMITNQQNAMAMWIQIHQK
jgi:serine/threonine protein phosphatase PrpC